jgi:hypothetical protein
MRLGRSLVAAVVYLLALQGRHYESRRFAECHTKNAIALCILYHDFCRRVCQVGGFLTIVEWEGQCSTIAGDLSNP